MKWIGEGVAMMLLTDTGVREAMDDIAPVDEVLAQIAGATPGHYLAIGYFIHPESVAMIRCKRDQRLERRAYSRTQGQTDLLQGKANDVASLVRIKTAAHLGVMWDGDFVVTLKREADGRWKVVLFL